MAYLATRRNPLVSDSGSAPVASAAGPSSSPAAPTDSRSGQGGGMGDLRAYLDANAEQSKALVDRLIGDPATRSGYPNTTNLTAQAAQAATPAFLRDPAYVLAGSQAEADENAKIQARNAKAQEMKGKIEGYASRDGLSQLLSDTMGTESGSAAYTPGMASLDAYVLGGAGANERLQALRDRWSGLLGDQAGFKGRDATPGPFAAAKPAPAPGNAGASPGPTGMQRESGHYFGPGATDPSKTPDGRPAGEGWVWSKEMGRWLKLGNGR